MLLMCEVCKELRTHEHMNHFHSVNVTRLNTKHIEFFTCKDGTYEGGQWLDCTSKAKEILVEISGKLTQFYTDEERAELLKR